MIRRIIIALALAACLAPARAQSFETIFWLDPQDVNDYAEFCRREYRVATKQDGPKLAEQMLDHQRVTLSVLPTPATGQTGKEFWTLGAPEWWKRVSQWPAGSSPAPQQASQNINLTKLWMGLSSYQRMRATLRASALAYQSLKGLRFEVNAWSMLRNLLVMEEGIAYDIGGGQWARVPRGSVSISVVPMGKENWRTILAQFGDSPWDSRSPNWMGPTPLKGLALEANEFGGDPLLKKPGMTTDDDMVAFLSRMDQGARTAAEAIMSVQLGVDQRRRTAMNDAFSPRRLASAVRTLNRRVADAYGSLTNLRALLEGRNPAEVQAEYNALVVFADDQARAAQAQAEMSAKFYSDAQIQAANVVAELETPERNKLFAQIEREYEALFNLSQRDGLMKDIDETLRNVNSVLTSLYPALAPYVGGMTIPLDYMAAINGTVQQADNDTKNPDSDIQAAYRDARIQALALRMNWVLREELRAARRLASIQEQVAAAGHALETDRVAWDGMTAAARVQNERAAQLHRMRTAAAAMRSWGMGAGK